MDAVDAYRVVAVVGASGSGKSSLVRAGLMPRLRRRTGDQVWQIGTMIPGGKPFLALARRLPLREPETIRNCSPCPIWCDVAETGRMVAGGAGVS